MIVAGVLLILCTALLLALLIWRRQHFSYFEKLGIPGPKPNLIWGNIREYHSTDLYKTLTKWADQYGDIYGFYNGDLPFVVIRDVDFVEYVFVRNFHNFMDRGVTMMTEQMHPVLKNSIMHVGAPAWKGIRACMGQSMSESKLKQMMPKIEEDAGIFVKSLEEYADSGKEVHMLHKFEELAMDYVARGAFGLDERFQGKPDHPLIAIAKGALRGIMRGPFHMIAHCTSTFGTLMKPLFWLSLMLEEHSFSDVGAQTSKIIQMRKDDPALRKPDILQNLIDAEYVEDSKQGRDNEASHGSLNRRALTTEEVITGATALFVAGFETTATGLSYIIYSLAKHPEVQEKLRREIIDTVGTKGSLDYETVMKRLRYLHYVVDEALRLYPPGLTASTRQAKEDFVFNGIKFRAGTSFMAPAWQMYRDPRYWTNPLEFNPDRFAPENETPQSKVANMAFGIGPRNCAGKRLGQLNTRYTVARLMQKYRFELGPTQMGSMELIQYGMVSTPSRGPWILIHTLVDESHRNGLST